MAKVQITTSGIKKVLQKYKYFQAIAEYIWNSFDANAKKVELNYGIDDFDTLVSLSISDNGYGINKSELVNKFVPFYDSEKIDLDKAKNDFDFHGKKGVGRLTFFSFAKKAVWTTIYSIEEKNYKYDIDINISNLDKYNDSKEKATTENTGTIVKFTDLLNFSGNQFEEELLPYLVKEFGWYLFLYEKKSLMINGMPINIKQNINDTDDVNFINQITKSEFKVKYVQWKEKINNQYSRYYFIDDDNLKKFELTTTLNNKGDSFYHSVFVRSSYFKDFVYHSEVDNQEVILSKSRKDEDFKFIKKEVDNYLNEKRKPFLNAYSENLIVKYEKEEVFPKYNISDKYERYKYEDLKEITKELYKAKPSLFTSLSVEQKKIFLKFLDVLLESDERDNFLEILENVLELDSNEKIEFLNIIKKTKLSNIVKTLKLIEDRFKAVEDLKQMVFNKELNANEVDDLQYLIEQHYWLFGEQYNLITAEEPDFEEALRRLLFFQNKENTNKIKLLHPDKKGQMDIFISRKILGADKVDHIVVELKHPLKNLGQKEYNQVDKYVSVVQSDEHFNGNNNFWVFILVGNKLDTSKYIERLYESNKHHGEVSLVHKSGNCKIFCKTWSEIFTDFEIKHKFIQDKLKFERTKLVEKYQSTEVIKNADLINTAHAPAEFNINN